MYAAAVPSTAAVYPKKFHQLERFFNDLKSDFGRRIQDPGQTQEPLLDIYILCTRRGRRWGQLLETIGPCMKPCEHLFFQKTDKSVKKKRKKFRKKEKKKKS